MSALEDLEPIPHLVCEDCWYSCPASGECCNDAAGDECDCGADYHNAQIQAAIAELLAQLNVSICIFCGETMAKDPVVMLEHAKGCEDRPENRLLVEIDELKAMLRLLFVDYEEIGLDTQDFDDWLADLRRRVNDE